MNQVIETIKKRRSVRSYDAKPIPKDILNTIIDAGNAAPSGANSQGWRFVAVTGEAFRKKLAELALPRYQKWLAGMPEPFKMMRAEVDASVSDPVYYDAPAIVFVVGFGMSKDFDCSMVCQNMMLAARSLGIGSCWVFIGSMVLDDKDVRETLELKEGEKVYGPLVLGYPKGDFPDSPAKKPPTVKWI